MKAVELQPAVQMEMDSSTSVISRIEKLCELQYAGVKNRMARETGISRSALSKMFGGDTETVQEKTIQRVLNNVTSKSGAPVSEEWLRYGRGPIFRNGKDEDIDNPGSIAVYSYSDSTTPRGEAGGGAYLQPFEKESNDVIVRGAHEVRELTGYDARNLRGVRVEGDSMEPTIKANTRALYVPNKVIDKPGVWYFAIDDRAVIKRVNILGGGAYLVRSDNKEKYPETETLIPLEDADTDQMYRVEETGLTCRLQVFGRIAMYCSVT